MGTRVPPEPRPSVSDMDSSFTVVNTASVSTSLKRTIWDSEDHHADQVNHGDHEDDDLKLGRNVLIEAPSALLIGLSASQLPPEILEMIFHHIPVRECYSTLRYVCSSWRTFVMGRGIQSRMDIYINDGVVHPSRTDIARMLALGTGIPSIINIQIVNGFAHPSRTDLENMKPGFNFVTSQHNLFASDGSPVPQYIYRLKTEPCGDYTVYLSPRKLDRQWIPNDDLIKPLYRVPYHIIDIENGARHGRSHTTARGKEAHTCCLSSSAFLRLRHAMMTVAPSCARLAVVYW
ncbi:hypothetical protein M427DRAFT_202499 [Gonapodya prolifera JEL478]|uniref:F-box domain-containing protein n=1 Tax=Gonapodya prolifera (strain JEL478) TaxID=1344416 RepID=A0A139A0K7_GONPJ|nr:hypothetical protein M427DRAFT_202499 [Gonapodya prolifera JEL478]|eukprot:KXS09893.1 hypothetical protein M427DRAFT_202499 [Gonapodya prolifera JEL478]